MKIHHTKHHQAYVDKLNKAIEGNKELEEMEIDELLENIENHPGAVKEAIRNNGGGHRNHAFFWKILKKDGGKPSPELMKALEKDFGSYDEFKEKFTQSALTRFGSGWAWLVADGSGKLSIMSMANQDNPKMQRKTPILGLDVWEHAYYLQYQWQRPKYIQAFFEVINWEQVNKNFQEAMKEWN